jgi:serine/threonine-protein kinase
MEPIVGAISGPAWWGQDGLVYENYGTLYRKTLAGTPEVFAKPDEAKRETYYYGASTTPDGRAVVFSIVREDTESFDRAVVAVKDLQSGVQKVLLSGGMSPRVTTTGHLLFGRAGALHAVEVDTDRWEVRGSPIAVVDDIVTEPTDGLTPYAVSDNGTLVYLQGRAQQYRRQVVFFDRRGRETPVLEPGPYSFLRVSPTGDYLALSAYGANVRTWLFDLRREALGLLTETWSNEGPAWSHDGTRLAHLSTRGGKAQLNVTSVRSAASETQLQSGSDISSNMSFSADDQYVLISDFSDIFRVKADGSADREALITSRAREIDPDASPDGKWLAFQSDDTGRFEVYVVPYASDGRRQRMSRDGGQQPRWTRQGRELCYRSGPTASSIACVAIGPDGRQIGEGRVIVDLKEAITAWDVSPDGERFYVIRNAIEGWQSTAPLQVVVNWFDELRAKLARSEKIGSPPPKRGHPRP